MKNINKQKYLPRLLSLLLRYVIIIMTGLLTNAFAQESGLSIEVSQNQPLTEKNKTITFTISIKNSSTDTIDVLPLYDSFTGPAKYIGGEPKADGINNVSHFLEWADVTQHFGDLLPNQSINITAIFVLENSYEYSITNTSMISDCIDMRGNKISDQPGSSLTIEQHPDITIRVLNYNDLNQNGIHDFKEPYIANREMILTDKEGNEIHRGFTNSLGLCVFKKIYSGEYTISEVPQKGWMNSQAGNNKFSDSASFTNIFTEENEITIHFGNYLQLMDFGDAPDTYGTSLSNNGARHIKKGYFIGELIDIESDGIPSINADGDMINPIEPSIKDDEDGVSISNLLIPGTISETEIFVNGSSDTEIIYLDAWIDYNCNGVFDHPTEHLFDGNSKSLTIGNNIFRFKIPSDAIPDTVTFARYRLSSTGNLLPTGEAPDGEVEDYQLDISQFLPMKLTNMNINFDNDNVVINWTTESEIENMGFQIYRATDENGDYHLISSFLDNPNLDGAGSTMDIQEYSFQDKITTEGIFWYKITDVTFNNIQTFHGPIAITVTPEDLIFDQIDLFQNYPNPFNPSTTLSYQISMAGFLDVIVYNMLGEKVRTLVSEYKNPGHYNIRWGATNDIGDRVPSGFYIVRLKTQNLEKSQTIMLMR